MGRLSYQLISNKFLEIEENERVLRKRQDMGLDVSDSHTSAKYIDLYQYSDYESQIKELLDSVQIVIARKKPFGIA